MGKKAEGGGDDDTTSTSSSPKRPLNVSGIKVPKKYRDFIVPTGQKLADEKKPRPRTTNEVELDNRMRDLVDAETNQPIKTTLANWNSKEGRVNCDAEGMINQGTGKLDITYRKLETQSRSPILHLAPLPQTASYNHRHPLVDRFLDEGPLTKVVHRYWNARSDEIEYDYTSLKDEGELEGLNLQRSDARDNEIISTAHSHHSPNSRHSQHSRHSRPSTARSANNTARLSTARSANNTSSVSELPSLLSDKKNWELYEKKIYKELYSMASQLEINKGLTGEKKLKG